MTQLFLCPQGHRWPVENAAMTERPAEQVACPVCGLVGAPICPEGLALDEKPLSASGFILNPATAFQDLAARSEDLTLRREAAPAASTAFQDLHAPPASGGRASTEGRRPAKDTASTAFTELPAQSERPQSGPQAPPSETGITLRFPGLRREPLGKAVPAVPGYEILEELGRTPTSIVYKARESSQQRLVAIKIITAGDFADSSQFSWLRAELQAVARLQHPCVLKIYDVGEHSGQGYIVMEYVDGGTLAQKIAGKPQGAHPTAQLLETLARTMAYVHEQKLVHRNLKPSNILLTSDGLPRITDFGMIRAADRSTLPAQAGVRGGDPSYMPPEQLQEGMGQRIREGAGARGDIYSLGAILYEMMTGRPPFLGRTPDETCQLVRTADPVTPTRLQLKVQSRLETVCLKCLQKDPSRRYESALTLAADLQLFLAGRPIQARPPGIWEHAWKAIGRQPIAAASLALGVVLLAALFGSLLFTRARLEKRLDATASALTRAEGQIEKARRERYQADMNLAQQAYQHGDFDRGLSLLAKHDGEADLRNFEWSYLWRLGHPDTFTTVAGDPGDKLLAAYSPDGAAIATAAIDNAKRDKPSAPLEIWKRGDSPGKRDIVSAPGKQAGTVCAFAFAPQGELFATANEDGIIHVWSNARAWQVRHILRGHTGAIDALAFRNDGQVLASGGTDGTVRLWNAESGKAMISFSGHVGGVSSIAFSPDGRLLAAGCFGHPDRQIGQVRLWDCVQQSERGTLLGHRGPVHAVAFLADGKSLVSGGGKGPGAGELKLWDASSAQWRADLPGCMDRVLCLAFEPDSGLLAVGSADTSTTLWSFERAPRVQAVLRGHKSSITSVAFARRGHALATASQDGTLKLWSVDRAVGVTTLRGYQAPPLSLAFARLGNTTILASAGGVSGQSGEVKIWDLARASGQPLLDQGTDRSVLAIALSPDGKLLVTGGESTLARAWQWTQGKAPVTLRGHAQWVSAVACSPAGNMVATGSLDADVRLWDAATGKEEPPLKGHKYPVLALAFSLDGSLLATGDAGHEVRIWKVSTRQELARLRGHSGPILGLAFAPNGQTLATAGGDQTIKLWDVAGSTERRTLRGHGHAVTSVAFAPDGKTLASGSRDGTVRLWDPLTGMAGPVLQGHTDWVTAVAFSPDGTTLASAGLDQTVKLWQAGAD